LTINHKNLASIKDYLKSYPNTKLLIVTKNQTQDDILELIEQGNKYFGENRIQEAKKKYSYLIENKNIKLHLIGPLQSNKTKIALKLFDSIQSIDRKSIVDQISKIIDKKEKIKTHEYFIQVNIGNEEQKSGVRIEDIDELYKYSLDKKLNIKGLMCLPPNVDDPSKFFYEMKKIRDSLNKSLLLSMGMSSDYRHALKYNSDIIRVGSAIFK
tara:strand:+ start:489 stop:1124 length:636 start_codon:yes stop_codon:yes gene_type:complete